MATPKLMIVSGAGSEPKGICEACGARFPIPAPNRGANDNRIVKIYVDFAVHRCVDRMAEPVRA